MLEHDFEHHTITDVVLADGEKYFSLPGRQNRYFPEKVFPQALL